MKHLFTLLFIAFIAPYSYAQVQPKSDLSKSSESSKDYTNASYVEEPEFRKLFTEAQNFFVLDNFYKALPIFLKVDSLYPNNSNVNFCIGVCYWNTSSKKQKALPYFEKAVKNVSVAYNESYNEISAPVFAYYYLAKVYHITYKLDKAINNFTKFLSFLNPNADADKIQDVNRQIEMCYTAKQMINNPLSIKIENLGDKINTAYPEYSPVLTKDKKTLYFTSRRPGSTGGKLDIEGKYYEDIYTSSKNTDGTWTAAVPITGKINSNGHEASISVSPNGDEIYIYKDDNNDGNIYVSKLESGQWSVPKKLGPNINTKYWETHACLSPDNSVLYFVSTRPGGYGGRDIYRSFRLSNGEWGPAQNLGPTINTMYDEESPFISEDGVTLYFSSQGHESMGDFDIFSSTLAEDGFWSKPENVGYPINTADKDVFYVPADETHAYYSSIKSRGFGEQDIYMITILSKKKQLVALSGAIADASTYKPLNAQIQIVDKEKNIVVANLNSNPVTGEYNVTLDPGVVYIAKVNSSDFDSYSEEFTIKPEDNAVEYSKNFFITKTAYALGKTKIDKSDLVVGKTIILKDIYYDFDKARLRPESIEELNRLIKLLNEIPTLKIEISSHTDSKGADDYNKDLSSKRAKSVVDYIISKGIDASRLTSKGYGKSKPIDTNSTEEGRQHNRRTEFKILSL